MLFKHFNQRSRKTFFQTYMLNKLFNKQVNDIDAHHYREFMTIENKIMPNKDNSVIDVSHATIEISQSKSLSVCVLPHIRTS